MLRSINDREAADWRLNLSGLQRLVSASLSGIRTYADIVQPS
jgi:hypothetical protein